MPFQLPDFLLALESKPSPAPRSPRHKSSSPSASRTPLSGPQKLRYAAYEPPPTARPRSSRATSSTRSTYSQDAHDDLSLTVTAGDLAIAAGSPEIRALALVRTPSLLRKMRQSDHRAQPQATRSPSIPPLSTPRLESVDLLVRVTPYNLHRVHSFTQKKTKTKQSPRADLISLDSPFIQEPKHAGKPNAPNEHDEQHHDFANAWDTLSAFSARGWCEGTIDTAVRQLQSLGLQRGLAVLPADQPPFEGTIRKHFFLSFSPLSPDLVPTGELKILILGDADGGQGRAALRLHDSSDNDEDGYLWRMRSEDEAVLMAVKQVLAT